MIVEDIYDTPRKPVPRAPLNLIATGGAIAVSLTWTAVSGPGITYNVYRGTSTNGESATPLATGVAATSYDDNTASSGPTYFYKVTAVRYGTEGPRSNETSGARSGGEG